jgi:hypothetical protein
MLANIYYIYDSEIYFSIHDSVQNLHNNVRLTKQVKTVMTETCIVLKTCFSYFPYDNVKNIYYT